MFTANRLRLAVTSVHVEKSLAYCSHFWGLDSDICKSNNEIVLQFCVAGRSIGVNRVTTPFYVSVWVFIKR
jgi:hypothetical protein